MTSTAPTVAETPRGRPGRGRRVGLLVGAGVIVLAALLVGGVVLFGGDGHGTTTTGSGNPATEVRALPAFTAVDLAGTNQVTVRIGAAQRVVVHADDNLIHNVLTRVRSGVLTVSDRGSFTTRGPMTVDVTVPALRAATLSGTGALTVTGIGASEFTARLAGTGTLVASGVTDRVQASLTGDGTLMLGPLRARDVTVTMPGTGTATVTATRSLDATLGGTGSILYHGDPAHVVTKVTGTGTITAR